ncbi:NADPH-dependent FMN reductase [Streptomyces sp. NPDC087901]|uniref:NADPH-dependent FMN reductase n=1 Tax=unclassified Streptomyces TaxID=2593676 RepID=UPI0034469639
MRISVVAGNPKAGSRTLGLAQTLAKAIAEPGDEITTIDLAEHVAEIFAWPSVHMAELNDAVAASDLVIFASPTFKATYTGLLKSFLDRYPTLGLKDVCAIPLMMGADNGHSMAPEVNLRPLLVELGALVPTRGLYLETPLVDRADEVVGAWIEANAVGLRQIRAASGFKAGAI